MLTELVILYLLPLNIVSSDHKLQLNINNVILQQLRSCKYLGVMFDDELSWKPHIDFILKKIINYTSIFHELISILPNDCIEQIYYALVHPQSLHGIEFFANNFTSHIEPELSTGHFSWTRPDPPKRWPDPTRDCRQKVWPDPTRCPTLPQYV